VKLENLQKFLEENHPNSKCLVSLHVIDGGRINHSFITQDFPNGDLMPCVKYLEDEFLKHLKRGASGNGRM